MKKMILNHVAWSKMTEDRKALETRVKVIKKQLHEPHGSWAAALQQELIEVKSQLTYIYMLIARHHLTLHCKAALLRIRPEGWSHAYLRDVPWIDRDVQEKLTEPLFQEYAKLGVHEFEVAA